MGRENFDPREKSPLHDIKEDNLEIISLRPAMNFRIKFARFLLRLGSFIQSLPVVVMKPDDLVEFSRQSYSKPQDVESWSEASLVDSGLSPDEQALIDDIPLKEGKLLLLGVGGGREAIVLAKRGFEVTGVDFIPSMVEQAKVNAAQRNVIIEGCVQEISNLDIPKNSHDVVWISRSMYSCIPTRTRRVAMVQRIYRSLNPGGYFVCQFHWDPRASASSKATFLRRLIALFTFGNYSYESGDFLWLNVEFLHAFSVEEEIRSELEEGGFGSIKVKISQIHPRAGAICQKISMNKSQP